MLHQSSVSALRLAFLVQLRLRCKPIVTVVWASLGSWLWLIWRGVEGARKCGLSWTRADCWQQTADPSDTEGDVHIT